MFAAPSTLMFYFTNYTRNLMNPYFKMVALVASVLLSIGIILPFLFSGDSFSVFLGFVYIILFPWVLWRACVGKIGTDPDDIIIGDDK
jgi:hypothetical protein